MRRQYNAVTGNVINRPLTNTLATSRVTQYMDRVTELISDKTLIKKFNI